MKIDELIERLKEVKAEHGNIEVGVAYRDGGGYYSGFDGHLDLCVVKNAETDMADGDSIRTEKLNKILSL